MSKKKAERRAAAGPAMDPAMMSYQMAPIPGAPPGPGNMNGNPMNVTGLGNQMPSMNGGMQENLYRDAGGLMYPQMGSDILNPMNVPRSQVQQNTPMSSRGHNAGMPFGMQMQPPAPMMDQMESSRLAGDAQIRTGMPNVSAMGMTGMPALPGSIPSEMAGQTGATMPLTPMPGPGRGGMTPDNMMQQQMGPQPTQTGGTMNMTPNPGPGPGGMTPDNMMGAGMAPDNGAMVPGANKKVIRKKGKK